MKNKYYFLDVRLYEFVPLTTFLLLHCPFLGSVFFIFGFCFRTHSTLGKNDEKKL